MAPRAELAGQVWVNLGQLQCSTLGTRRTKAGVREHRRSQKRLAMYFLGVLGVAVGDWLLTILFASRRTMWMMGGCARVVVCVYACVSTGADQIDHR